MHQDEESIKPKNVTEWSNAAYQIKRDLRKKDSQTRKKNKNEKNQEKMKINLVKID